MKDYLVLKNISYQVKTNGQEIEILKDICLSFPSAGLYVLQGPNGSGKTTLLNILSGYLTPNSGDIYLNGKNINNYHDISTSISFLFQDLNLIENFTILENLNLVESNNSLILERLDEFNLVGRENDKVKNLSGGEKQKVALIRALLKKSQVIVLDEPTNSLDIDSKSELLKIINDLSKDHLVLFVTHDSDISSLNNANIVEVNQGKVLLKQSFDNKCDNEIKESTYIPYNNSFKLSLKLIKTNFLTYLKEFIVFIILLSIFIFTGNFLSTDQDKFVERALRQDDIYYAPVSLKDDDIISGSLINNSIKEIKPEDIIHGENIYIDENILENRLLVVPENFKYNNVDIKLKDNRLYTTSYFASKIHEGKHKITLSEFNYSKDYFITSIEDSFDNSILKKSNEEIADLLNVKYKLILMNENTFLNLLMEIPSFTNIGLIPKNNNSDNYTIYSLYKDEIPLVKLDKPNEVVVTRGYLMNLYGEDVNQEDYIGTKLYFKKQSNDFTKINRNFNIANISGEFIIKGVVDQYNDAILVSKSFMEGYYQEIISNPFEYYCSTSLNNIRKLNQNNLAFNTKTIHNSLNEYNKLITNHNAVIVILSVVSMSSFIALFILFNANRMKKEERNIAIFKSLSFTNKTISKIYLYISLVSFLAYTPFSILVTYLVNLIINLSFSNSVIPSINKFIVFNPMFLIISLITLLLINCISLLLIYLKNKNKHLLDYIRK